MRISVRERPGREPTATARRRQAADRLPGAVEAALATPGEPLDVATRTEMERRLGHDFGDVRVHTDARAAAAARALDADAFTSGADIVFAEGHYRPQSPEGRELLVHELVHTLQQGRDESAVSLQVPAPIATTTDPLEAEAATVVDRIATGAAVPPGLVSVAAPAARGRIARRARAAIERAVRDDSSETAQAVADDVARLLTFDPEDAFARVRRRLAPLAPGIRDAVAAVVRGQVTGPAAARLDAILSELRPSGGEPPPESKEPVQVERPSLLDALVGAWSGVVDRLRPRPEPTVAAAPAETRGEAEPTAVVSERQPMPTDAEPTSEQIAATAVAGRAAAEATPATTEPGEPLAAAAEPPARDAAAPTPIRIEETSETGEGADARIAEDGAVGPEDVAEGTADEGPADEGPADEGAVAEDAEPVAAPEEPQSAADLPADAPPPGEASEATSEATDEATSDATNEAVDEAAAGTEPAESSSAVPAPVDTSSSVVGIEEQGQPGAEPAVEPSIGMVPLGEPAEIESDEDDTDAGAGSGAAMEEAAAPEVPVIGGDPEAGVDAVASLPPTVAAAAWGGVRAAVTHRVAAERDELAAAPPQLDRPTGAPARAAVVPEAPTAEVAPPAPTRVQRAPAGSSVPTPAPAPMPPAPAPAIATVPVLPIAGAATPLTETDVVAIRNSVKALPTTDPALDVTAGAPPPLVLEGDADPATADRQRTELDKAAVAARTEGAADAAAPMGESAVLPSVTPQMLRAELVGARAPAVVPAPPIVPDAPDPAVDAVIAEQRPGELQSAAATARAGMATERAKQAQATETARVESRANIEKEVADNAAQQRSRRDDLRRDVREQREQWTEAQQGLVDTSQAAADEASADLTAEVTTERAKGTAAAEKHIAEGDAKVAAARQTAERQAKEAQEGKEGKEGKGPSGFLGWAASQATAFFERIKTAIKAAFEAARKAVKDAVETAQKLAAGAIDAARKAVVTAIKAAGDALIEIGDRLLAGFPALRTRFRGAIQAAVGVTQRAVDALVDGLEVAVQTYLNLYAKALDGILGLLETGLLAAVDGYGAAVLGAIKAAQFVLNGLGDLLQVAKDIASGPRAWLRNLGAAIVDGVRNHLWAALEHAVSEWFTAKVDAVLGLGRTAWNLLAKGGITLAAVAEFAFKALRKVIPIALVKLLITKLVGMLVPAAAAVMAIVEGLQAAWGAAGSIIGAISKFVVFLKAVKGGNAGRQFAEAAAAAAVAVIDFVSSWLLRRLLKPAAKIGKAIKGVATRIAAMLRRGLKKVTRRVKAWIRKAGRRFDRLKDRFFGKKKKRKLSSVEKLARAQRELPPKIQPLLDQGVSALRLGLQLAGWRLRYRLGSLRVVGRGAGRAKITATGSRPEVDIIREVIEASGDKLHKLIREIADDLFREPKVVMRARDIAKQRIDKGLGEPDRPIRTGEAGPAGHVGQAIDIATERRGKGTIWHEVQTGSATGLVSEVQGFSQRVGHTRVVVVPGDYIGIAAGWDEFHARPEQRVRLARLYSVESARSRSQAVVGPAALGLARVSESLPPGHPARVTYPQALVDLNPAQPQRAVRHLHELNRRLGHPGGSPGRHESSIDATIINDLLAREKAFLVALVYQKMSIERLRTSSEEAVRRFIRRELRNALESTALSAMESAL